MKHVHSITESTYAVALLHAVEFIRVCLDSSEQLTSIVEPKRWASQCDNRSKHFERLKLPRGIGVTHVAENEIGFYLIPKQKNENKSA
jgi:hypothetical protein